MQPFRPAASQPPSITPLRRARPVAFVESAGAPVAPRAGWPFGAAPPPPLLPCTDIADMVVSPHALPTAAPPRPWTYSVSPRMRSMDELQQLVTPPSDAALHEQEQEQAIVSFNLKDKMGLFFSVCSVLVSIQMFTPRAM